MNASKAKSPRAIVAMLIAAAVLVRIVCAFAMPIGTEADMLRRTGDEKYYFQIAHAIVERGEFVEGHLRAYRPPLYPAFLALHLALFGDRTWVLAVVQNVIVLAAAGILALLVAKRYGPRAGVVGAAMILFSPTWLLLPQQAYSESIFLLLLVGGLALVVRLTERPSAAAALGAGVLFGGAALGREIGLLMGLAILGCFWLSTRKQLGARAVKLAGVALVGMSLVVGSWTARNYSVFDRVVPISTNGPINLYIGNSPEATGYFHFKIPPRSRAVWNTPSDHGKNEIESMSAAGQEAIDYMKAHPGRTAELAMKKLAVLWVPIPRVSFTLTPGGFARYARMAYLAGLAGLAFYSLWKMRGSFLGKAILGVAVVTSVVHVITHVDLRFRAPADALLAMPAAMSVLALVERLRSWLASRGATKPPRAIGGGAQIRPAHT